MRPGLIEVGEGYASWIISTRYPGRMRPGLIEVGEGYASWIISTRYPGRMRPGLIEVLFPKLLFRPALAGVSGAHAPRPH